MSKKGEITMATIDYKEKYEKAVQAAMRAKQDTESAVTVQTLEEIFPELKESKDERIRKALMNIFNTHKDYEVFYGVSTKEILAWLEKQAEQKPTEWSEEDVRKMRAIITIINSTPQSIICSIDQDRESLCNWLKSLRPQPRQETTEEEDREYACQSTNSYTRREQMIYNLGIIDGKNMFYKPSNWSEEDETVLNNLIFALANDRIGNNRDEYVDWLKSFRPRNTWKPSEEQMRVLDLAIRCGINRGTTEEATLVSLFNDLKKLK